ncbi:site-2 protease family protein [Saccharomonospora azurea]|uniref:site-2 protease family protein n=1 Tax=Saccharomonospora azurea TaxID=40988 RepID=UPI0002FD49CA|nr:site-2 protease family protein [Saccharomonospora azurea]
MEVHSSAAAAVAVLTAVFALGLLPVTAAEASIASYWFAGFGVALAVFASLLLHELAHAAVARRYGVGTRRVVLWLLGGAAEQDTPAPTPLADAVIAVAGPLASAALGVTSWAVALVMAPLLSPTALAALLWLGTANLAWAVFVLLPGAPLDGGRILRALVWSRTRDRHHGDRTARRGGRALGVLLLSAGAAVVILFGQFVGVWFAVAGWALWAPRTITSAETGPDAVPRSRSRGDIPARRGSPTRGRDPAPARQQPPHEGEPGCHVHTASTRRSWSVSTTRRRPCAPSGGRH